MKDFNETGRLLERRVFGECRWRCGGYLSYRQALEMVLKHQGGETTIVRAVRVEVAKQLGVSVDVVKFFTAVGENPMDRKHGIDAVLVFGNVVVSLDITKNSNKDSTKADILVVEEDLGDIPTLAGRIARVAAQKSGRVNHWRAV